MSLASIRKTYFLVRQEFLCQKTSFIKLIEKELQCCLQMLLKLLLAQVLSAFTLLEKGKLCAFVLTINFSPKLIILLFWRKTFHSIRSMVPLPLRKGRLVLTCLSLSMRQTAERFLILIFVHFSINMNPINSSYMKVNPTQISNILLFNQQKALTLMAHPSILLFPHTLGQYIPILMMKICSKKILVNLKEFSLITKWFL